MADKRKSLDEIRPARGAKLKRKVNKTLEQHQKQVLQNVGQPSEEEAAMPPTEDAAKVMAELNEAKGQFLEAMKDFNKLLNVKTLIENKSQDDRKNEQQIVNRLVQTAKKIEDITNTKEAIIGLCVFSIRQSLSLRDAGNSLAYELLVLKTDVDQIKKDIYETAEESDEK